jgi:hypothetical protein
MASSKPSPITPMPAERSGDGYHSSVRIKDVGGASEANPNPKAPFVDPNPGSPIINDDWKKKSS